MLILHLTTTDPAGSVFNLVSAINAHTPHRARLITTAWNSEYQFPTDIYNIMDSGNEIAALFEKADVVHLHKVKEDFSVDVALDQKRARRFSVAKLLGHRKGLRVVYHVHGHPNERADLPGLAHEYAERGRPVLTATPDLEEAMRPYYDGVQWMPHAVPIHDVRYLPSESDGPQLVGGGEWMYLVAQTPTHTILKNCHVISDAVREVGARLPVAYLKIWGKPLDTALRLKRSAHVVFDHLRGYYGMSSLEGLSMGKPTMTGLSDYCIRRIGEFWGIDRPAIPWLVVRNHEDIVDTLKTLFQEDGHRLRIGAESRRFMEAVWSDAAVAGRFARLYETL